MRINHPALIKIIGRLGGAALWTLFRTVRVAVETDDVNPYDCPHDKYYLYSVWHDSVLMAAFGGRHRGMVALASRHRDGRLGASLVAGVGVKSVQGSSGRGGQTAVRRLIKLAETHDVVITPDGPRGPRRTMSRGIIYLAAKTGNAVVPTAFHCNRAWEIRGSWTHLTVPQPFSRVRLAVGPPIRVPNDVSECELDEYAAAVQQSMDRLRTASNPVTEHVDRMYKKAA